MSHALFRLLLARTLASVTLVSLGATADAATYTWNGGGSSSSWSNSSNWNGNQVPASSGDSIVVFGGTTNLTASQDISSDFVLNSLTFNSGAGAFVLGGATLDFHTSSAAVSPTISESSSSNTAVNNNLVLTNNLAVNDSYGGSGPGILTLGGSISGAGSLTMTPGQGTLVLSGSNSYTGGTIFAAGILNAGSAGALGSNGTLSFTGGTLQYSAANMTDYSARFSTAAGQKYSIDINGQNVTVATNLTSSGGSLTVANSQVGGTLTLTGSNTFTGGVNIGSTLNVASAQALGTTGTISFTGGTLQYSSVNTTDYSSRFSTANYQIPRIDTNGQNVTFATGITGTNDGLFKMGAGTLTLTGTNTYGFATEVMAGALTLPTGGAITNSYVVVSGGATFNLTGGSVGPDGLELGTTAGTATTNFSSGTLNTNVGYIGYANGSIAVLNQTGGSSNATMYVGDVTGSNGTYNLSGGSLTAQAFVGYSGTGTFTQSGGTVSGGVLVGYNASSNGFYTLNTGNMSGSISVGVSGIGTFTQNGGTITNSGLNIGSFAGSSGTYNLNSGTLAISSGGGGSGTSTFNFNGGTVQSTASRTNFFQGFTTTNVQAGGAIIDTQTYNVTVAENLVHDTTSGAAAMDGGLTKLGVGTLTLSGTNTYTGGTTISTGMLTVASNGALGTGNVSVVAGATLSLSSGVTAAHNASTGTTLTLASATTSIVNLAGTGVQDTVGILIINGVTEPLGTYGATGSGAMYTSIADFTGTGELSVVPEPSTWLTVSMALGLGLILRRQRRAEA